MNFVVGIDASRNRSGGSKVHLRGILADSDPREFGIREVHVWSFKSLLDSLPNTSWIVKHNPPELELSLFEQLKWQYFSLPDAVSAAGCDILLNTDAGSICRFRPAVIMSRDMLSYEPGEIERFGWSRARARLIALRYVQNASLRFGDGVIFLTHHAAKTIQRSTGPLKNVAIVPHGVGANFKRERLRRDWPPGGDTIECLYVSNAALYKHQWVVVRALAEIRSRGYLVRLRLVGGGAGKAQRLLDEAIERYDPQREWTTCVGFVAPENLPEVLAAADLFIFASSCENMPNTLLEAMAGGLPIACSNRGPMPEILGDAGVFFDPENSQSIADAVERLIADGALRAASSARAAKLAAAYSWSRCGSETWRFLISTLQRSGL